MSIVRDRIPEVGLFDVVELTASTDGVAAGARGGVLELPTDGVAMVEITEPALEGVDRIAFLPVTALRVVS